MPILLWLLGVPIVVIDRRLPDLRADVVRCDSEGGAYDLTRLLISLGHQEIAILNGPRDVSTAQERVTGYHQALAEAGIELQAECVIYGEYTLESGSEMARQALQAIPRPTALVASNNFIAIGALKVLRELKIRVPEDISLVGFDDLPPDLVVDPFLTAAAQPAYEMGHRATELLLERLSGQGPEAIQEIILPVEMMERRSCGPAPA